MNNALFLELGHGWYLHRRKHKVYVIYGVTNTSPQVYITINASNFNDALKILEPYALCR